MIKYNAATKAKYNANVKPNVGFHAEIAGKFIVMRGKVDLRVFNGLLDKGYIIQFNGRLFIGGKQ